MRFYLELLMQVECETAVMAVSMDLESQAGFSLSYEERQINICAYQDGLSSVLSGSLRDWVLDWGYWKTGPVSTNPTITIQPDQRVFGKALVWVLLAPGRQARKLHAHFRNQFCENEPLDSICFEIVSIHDVELVGTMTVDPATYTEGDAISR